MSDEVFVVQTLRAKNAGCIEVQGYREKDGVKSDSEVINLVCKNEVLIAMLVRAQIDLSKYVE